MIKYLGSLGTFIRLNDNENKTYQLLNVFSSSAANYSLFSAEVNNSTGAITFDSASTSIYVNGVSASVLPSQEWAHMTFVFNDELATYESNDFKIRFGDSASSNFNIQNLYMTRSVLSPTYVEYIHNEFTGKSGAELVVSDSASFSINLIDTYEDNYISSDNSVYQPLDGQGNFLTNIAATTASTLVHFTSSAVTMANDDLYLDGYNFTTGDRLLSLYDNEVYELNASAYLTTVSSSVGDFVKTLYGQQYGGLFYTKAASGFTVSPGVLKIGTTLNTL